MEYLKCIIWWGFDAYFWVDSEDRANVTVTRNHPDTLPIFAHHPLLEGALADAYSQVSRVVQEERNAARENTGVKERATPE
jgi:hypothetical protein